MPWVEALAMSRHLSTPGPRACPTAPDQAPTEYALEYALRNTYYAVPRGAGEGYAFSQTCSY